MKIFLTPTEYKVLDLFSQGMTMREISVCMGISPKTVDTYLTRVADKLPCVGDVSRRWLYVRIFFIKNRDLFEPINLQVKYRKERNIKIYQLLRAGLTAKQISSRIGINVNYCRRLIKLLTKF